MLQNNDKVKHDTFGTGTVIALDGNSAIIRFENNNLQQCPISELSILQDIRSEIKNANLSNADEVLAKVQASIIQTINNKWGVFSRSSIDLLPHQLWVCNKVLKEWPVHYLVADDVGLGKTIEAGLMIWSLRAAKKANRILILTPAPLTYQWSDRLSALFDLDFDVYTTQAEQATSNYWNSHSLVIASAPTMQVNTNHRQDKIMEAEPWDLVIVDEAHHMNATERQGKTLQYQFFEMLEKANRVISVILFTGTPHRGFDFGFLSLMNLVQPAVFDPRGNKAKQFAELPNYFIRNNKQNTVDMDGKPLFHQINQQPRQFHYTNKEALFYDELSEFIEDGKAYALSKSGNICTSIQLVLIALQKLASSSIAAVTSALITRRKNLQAIMDNKKKEIDSSYKELFWSLNNENDAEDDDENLLEKSLEKSFKDGVFQLMENEISSLNSLIETGESITNESRIDEIIKIVDAEYPNENVLFFTEYKKTQALLMKELMAKWGEGCVTFINGDESLPSVIMPDGTKKNFSIKRQEAAAKFNNNQIRFLISTEAAGEGIDLQKNCHVLIHVDIPWNPMRLHQRVGRINRYGQQKDVDVITLRNPDTVESMIWEKLEMKIQSITHAFRAGMDDPDDMMKLVLGLQSNKFYEELYTGGISVARKNGNVQEWFDAKTKTFGGEGAVSLLNNMIGNASKFNLEGLPDVPKSDLPDLIPFFKRVIQLQGRKLRIDDDRYSFLTPPDWLNSYLVIPRYDNLIFRRKIKEDETSKQICGVGHTAFDKCLEYADSITSSTCCIEGKKSYFIYKVYDKKSYSAERITKDLIVFEYDSKTRDFAVLSLDNFIKILNKLNKKTDSTDFVNEIPESIEKQIKSILMEYGYELPAFDMQFVLCGEE